MIKPHGERVIVKIMKRYLKEKNGKQMLDENGVEVYDQEQDAKVMSSNIDGIKRGMTVYPVIRGGVPIYKQETKKHTIVVIDKEDIYATEV